MKAKKFGSVMVMEDPVEHMLGTFEAKHLEQTQVWHRTPVTLQLPYESS